MSNYFTYLKKAFEKPVLNNDGTTVINRTASPLELFFDLIFVILFANIGHLFYEPTFSNMLLAIALFLSIYMIWTNMNMFFMRFFGSTYKIRFGLIIVMIPLLVLAGIEDFHTQRSVYLIVFGFFLSRVTLIVLWYRSVVINETIDNQIFKWGVKIDITGFSISASMILLVLFWPTVLVLSSVLLISIFVEYGYIKYRYSKLTKGNGSLLHNDKMPGVDYKLLKERHLLFLILIFGEGIVSSIHAFSTEGELFISLFHMLLIFIIVILFFTRVYEEFLILEYTKEKSENFLYTHLVFSFILLILFSILGAIMSSELDIELAYRIIISIILMYISISHFFNNRKKSIGITSISQKDFKKIDQRMNILMFLIAILILFITNQTFFLLLLMLYFILHIVAMPYRYQLFKVKLYDEINFEKEIE